MVLGINRSGTKLASYLIAKSCGLRHICFEPFRWEGGIDTRKAGEWGEQLAGRRPSKKGRAEHLRLPVYCDGSEDSKWLSSILCKRKWDLVKFVQIGRCRLYQSLCPEACVVGLIRAPIAQFASLCGSTVQKDDVADQWRRLKEELALQDPLPEAEKWLPLDLADCARAYVTLYGLLNENLPATAVRVSYESLTQDRSWIERIAGALDVTCDASVQAPMLGVSTSLELKPDQQKYLEEKLTPTYREFLS